MAELSGNLQDNLKDIFSLSNHFPISLAFLKQNWMIKFFILHFFFVIFSEVPRGEYEDMRECFKCLNA